MTPSKPFDPVFDQEPVDLAAAQALLKMARERLRAKPAVELTQLNLPSFLKCVEKNPTARGIPVYYAVWPVVEDKPAGDGGIAK